jgi:hypothetical protein
MISKNPECKPSHTFNASTLPNDFPEKYKTFLKQREDIPRGDFLHEK